MIDPTESLKHTDETLNCTIGDMFWCDCKVAQLNQMIQEIIGDDIDTQSLVQAGEREKAKYGFEINAEKKQQRMRLNKAFGIPEPPEPDNRWWLSEEEKAKEKK